MPSDRVAQMRRQARRSGAFSTKIVGRIRPEATASADVAIVPFSNTVDERGRIKGARWRGISSTPLRLSTSTIQFADAKPSGLNYRSRRLD
jgi:hypothetical protein